MAAGTFTAARFMASVAGLLKALLPVIAYFLGKWAGIKSAYKRLDAANAVLALRYAEISRRPLTDEDVDKRLDNGKI